MSEGKIFYVLNVKFVDRVPMLERQRNAAKEWLRQWTPRNNFMAAATDSIDTAIEAFRKDFAKMCAAVGYPPNAFDFAIGETKVERVDGISRFNHLAEAHARVVATDVEAGVPS